jgi:hypothetical protein
VKGHDKAYNRGGEGKEACVTGVRGGQTRE